MDKMKTILVIDDDPAMLELISDFCDGMGYRVESELESVKALARVQELKPDLITLDLQMPTPDGFDLLKQIKADPALQHIPILIVSVLASDAQRQGFMDMAQAFFNKPIDFSKFKDKIEQLAKKD